jgi:ribosomal protein L16 Arg81 hydroxylase
MTTLTSLKSRAAEVAKRPGSALASIIDPIDSASFVADYWERKPLLVRRDDPAFYANLLTFEDVDYILANSGLRESDLRVVVDGQNLWQRKDQDARGHFAPGTLEDVYRAYRTMGATINLTYLHERWEPLVRLSQKLTAELTMEVTCAAYLTAGGAHGLKAHYDTHDIFVAQISGTKHWRLYDSPHPLPLQDQRYYWPVGGPGDPIAEVDVTPGDLLYVPRGLVHDATSADEPTLHLAIGVVPVRWADLISAVVTEITGQDSRFRAAVPTRFTHADWQPAAEQAAAGLLADLAAMISPRTLLAEFTATGPRRARPALHGHLSDLKAIASIGPATQLQRRPQTRCRLAAGPARMRLDFHGKSLTLPARYAAAVRFITEAQPFTLSEIPGDLDEPDRLQLVTSLVREGFLTVLGEGENDAAADPA